MTDNNSSKEIADARAGLGRLLAGTPSLVEELRAQQVPEPPVMVTGPGIYLMNATDYHADPCPAPSLSASTIVRMCKKSLSHARQYHPRLVKYPTREASTAQNTGTIVHKLLLEGENCAQVIEAPDWRTNAAKEQRDTATKAGLVPILKHEWLEVQAMLLRLRRWLDVHPDGQFMFKHGEAERVLVWQEDNGIWCRARLDYLRAGAIDDYKSTSSSAAFEDLERRMRDEWSIKSAFYTRGLQLLTGGSASMKFAVQETYAPWAVSVVASAPTLEAIAVHKCERAIELWAESLRTSTWPGYRNATAYIGAPEWYEAKYLAGEEGSGV